VTVIDRLSSDQERRLAYILQEYLSVRDVNDAVQSVKELSLVSTAVPGVVSFLFNSVLERSTSDMTLTGQLLSSLVSTKHITHEQFFRGVEELVVMVPDLQVDVPKIWDYIGTVLSPLVLSHTVTLRQLLDCCQSPGASPTDKSTLLGHVLTACLSKKDVDTVQKLWQSSGITWSHLLPAADDLHKFLTDMGLGFLSDESLSSFDSQTSPESSSRLKEGDRATGLTVERQTNEGKRP